MKRLLLLPALLLLTGCQTTEEVPDKPDKTEEVVEEVEDETTTETNPDTSVELTHLSDLTASEILNSMMELSEAELGMGYETTITEDNIVNFLGTSEYPEFRDTAVYAPMMNIDVSLLVVLQASDISDVDEIVDQLVENIDPNRLICVSFDYEDMVIRHMEDTIVLIINPTYKDALDDAFMNLVLQ